ncbi:hypothetical protein SHKM778_42640 [Streptomyces sp. KM77-8]|uniref:Uncharacterized protein n=1 Tax=Streptomyces haneummycinicus TaxID=3074435 RepID=A0AAT9HK42_9ACTN
MVHRHQVGQHLGVVPVLLQQPVEEQLLLLGERLERTHRRLQYGFGRGLRVRPYVREVTAVLGVQGGDVSLELVDPGLGVAHSRLEVVLRSSERQVGSPCPLHCEHRSDEHHKQDPQQWIPDQ